MKHPSLFQDPVLKARAGDNTFSLRALAWTIYVLLSNKIDKKLAAVMDDANYKVKKVAPDKEAVPTRAKKDPVKELRKDGRTGAHIAFMMFNDLENKFKQRLIALNAGPFTTACGIHAERCRSVDQTLAYKLWYLKGGFFDPVYEILKNMLTRRSAEYIGLTVDFDNLDVDSEDHPQVC